MRADKAYDELIRRGREEGLLTTVEALLEWDEETYMPSGGVENRSEQLALLAGLLHERGTDPRIGELLGEVEGSNLLADPLAPAAVNVRVLRRDYDRSVLVPRSLVEEVARTTALAQKAWATARADARFSTFRPWLEKIVEL
jgi:carboxypeptidase Taq